MEKEIAKFDLQRPQCHINTLKGSNSKEKAFLFASLTFVVHVVT
jgi:hypothetical protein